MIKTASIGRPTWDDVWMRTAISVSQRSLCERANVGAVVVTKNNRVMAASFNGAPDIVDVGGKPCSHWCERMITGEKGSDYSNCPAIHAELNALIRADYTQIQGGTLYVTGAVCANCAKVVMGSGIARVVYKVNEGEDYRNPDAVIDQLTAAEITVVGWKEA